MEKNAQAVNFFKKVGPLVAIWLLITFLLSPFILLYVQIGNLDFPASDELIWCLQNTTIQASGSAVFSLLFGIWGAAGLLSLKKEKWRLFWEVVFLLPNFVPPLFVVLAIFKTVEPFPIGLVGLIFVHSFINAGLVAVLLARIVDQKVGPLVELALIEGAGRFQFARVILRMLRLDLVLLFLLIFSICFMSFSIPLLAGGDQGTTLEVLIFEKVRLSSQWNQALGISFLQCVFLFIFSLVAPQETKTVKREKRN
ncbi:MAG: ABC transporter permease subunit, partial [Pseudobdellovibrionaceae bacterium]